MCTLGIEATSLIAIMLYIDSRLKCTSLGKNLKSAICVKVFDPQFVYAVKVLSKVQSRFFPIIDSLLHTLEVEQVSRSIHDYGIITLVLQAKPTRICNSPVPDLLPVCAPPPRPPPLPQTRSEETLCQLL